MELHWQRFDVNTLKEAMGQCYCLYAFHHPADGDRPFYIGKAKYFGTKQAEGYKASARYNGGYVHLIEGMLRQGFSLYVACIGERAFAHAEAYEQELIARWQPVRVQRKKKVRKRLFTVVPWKTAANKRLQATRSKQRAPEA